MPPAGEGRCQGFGVTVSLGVGSTTGLREAALGSCEVTGSLATYLSFLKGLLGRLVASLQPCEEAVGRVVCLEHE